MVGAYSIVVEASVSIVGVEADSLEQAYDVVRNMIDEGKLEYKNSEINMYEWEM
jgi:hypothetical protein